MRKTKERGIKGRRDKGMKEVREGRINFGEKANGGRGPQMRALPHSGPWICHSQHLGYSHEKHSILKSG